MENTSQGSSLGSYLIYGLLAVIAAGVIYLFYWASRRFSEVEKVLDSHSDFLARMYQSRQPPQRSKVDNSRKEQMSERNNDEREQKEIRDDESEMTEKTFVDQD